MTELLPVLRNRVKVLLELKSFDGETQVQPGVQARGCRAGQGTGRCGGAGGPRSGPACERVTQWVREQSADPQQAFSGHGQVKPEQLEIEKLRREVAKLKAERDIPKKAAAYFARDSIWGSRLWRSTEGSGQSRVSVRRSACLARASMHGLTARRVDGPSMTGCWSQASVQALLAAVAPMAPAGSGTTCWPKVSMLLCIASSA